MTDIEKLLKEAIELGILNIDVDTSCKQLTPELIQVAINATKRLNAKLDNNDIAMRILEADRLVALYK
jgi:hypothetical protein